MSSLDKIYMQRCLQLAAFGHGNVAPNPMVGAVLVYNEKIIGEGYHRKYGEAHAEPNCLNSVVETNREFISKSILYVSLEPCSHFGKTPPCADLIIKHRIPKVVVGCRDPFALVDGSGIDKLQKAGIEVEISEIEDECRQLNRRFFTFHQKKRPFIILKWAQTADSFVGIEGKRLGITGSITNQRVHQWRSQESAIAVGAGTALADDPQLTTRLYPGRNPLRVLYGGNRIVPKNLAILDDSANTIVFNASTDLSSSLSELHYRGILSVIVEGGPKLQQSFIDAGLWDEARILINPNMNAGEGIAAPKLKGARFTEKYSSGSDLIQILLPTI